MGRTVHVNLGHITVVALSLLFVLIGGSRGFSSDSGCPFNGQNSSGRSYTPAPQASQNQSQDLASELRVRGHAVINSSCLVSGQDPCHASLEKCACRPDAAALTTRSSTHGHSPEQTVVLPLQQVCAEGIKLLQYVFDADQWSIGARSVPRRRNSAASLDLSGKQLVGRFYTTAATTKVSQETTSFTQAEGNVERRGQREGSGSRGYHDRLHADLNSANWTTSQSTSSASNSGTQDLRTSTSIRGHSRAQDVGSYAATLCGKRTGTPGGREGNDGHAHHDKPKDGGQGAPSTRQSPCRCQEGPRCHCRRAADLRDSVASLHREAHNATAKAIAGARGVPCSAQRSRGAMEAQSFLSLKLYGPRCCRRTPGRRRSRNRREHARGAHGGCCRNCQDESGVHHAVQPADLTGSGVSELSHTGGYARQGAHSSREASSNRTCRSPLFARAPAGHQEDGRIHGGCQRRGRLGSRLANCAAAAHTAVVLLGAPRQGLGTSHSMGLHGPVVWNGLYGDHSICQDDTYLAPWLAVVRALRLEFEVSTADLSFVKHAGQYAWLCDEHGQPPRGSEANRCFVGSLQAQVRVVQPKMIQRKVQDTDLVEVRTITGFSPRTPMDSCDAEGKLPLFVRASWESPVSSVQQECRLPGSKSSTDLYCSVQCTASCSKGSAVQDAVRIDASCNGPPFKTNSQSSKNVSFGFAVDFWFPHEDQLGLHGSLSGVRPAHRSPRSCLKPNKTTCRMRHEAYDGNCTSVDKVPGFRTAVPVPDVDADGFAAAHVESEVLAAATITDPGPEGCFPGSGSTAAFAPCLGTCTSLSHVPEPCHVPPASLPQGQQSRRAFRPLCRLGPAPFAPTAEAASVSVSSALMPGLQPIPHHGLPRPSARPGRFTSFDILDQARSFTRNPDWDLQRCLFEAVSSSSIPGPVGR